jgi:hypothetical protein
MGNGPLPHRAVRTCAQRWREGLACLLTWQRQAEYALYSESACESRKLRCLMGETLGRIFDVR